jgi:hypothetical protein
MVGIEAGWHVGDAHKAAHQQAGADEKRQRDGKLCDHQRSAQLVMADTQPAAERAPGPRLKACGQIDMGGTKSRSQAEDDPRGGGDHERERKHAKIQSEFIEAGNVSRMHSADQSCEDSPGAPRPTV